MAKILRLCIAFRIGKRHEKIFSIMKQIHHNVVRTVDKIRNQLHESNKVKCLIF